MPRPKARPTTASTAIWPTDSPPSDASVEGLGLGATAGEAVSVAGVGPMLGAEVTAAPLGLKDGPGVGCVVGAALAP